MDTSASPGFEDELSEAERLELEFPHWRIWRSRGGRTLVATRTVDDDIEPTVMADSPDELRNKLRHPGKRAGRLLNAEQMAAIVAVLSR
ncbi:hypothetical protein O4J56_04705 [Nocardiopsis sp. RSe5-2]|uniref:Uncharacterized protein n=1 Tax=Nocardiopsis endophytica TaxID=3018445 RepID=A0ABT4U0A1_9ACTN|nr:hypothetical protein [Nocardiopsis endophytica]MDA2809929.1 hypothetical protein [Nocardiopsis endophytica]